MKKTRKKVPLKSQPKTQVKDPEIKKHETFDLNLTKFELLHLRDLMSVLLPPDGGQTLSEALASVEERSLIESMLWDKLSKLCKTAKLPVDAEAPDYIVAPVSAPPMGIFQVNQDLEDSKKKLPTMGFLPEDNEVVEEED